MSTFLEDCVEYQKILNKQTHLPMTNNKTMKIEIRRELDILVNAINRTNSDLKSKTANNVRNFNSIKTSVDKQNDIINLILEHLKVEVIEEDYIKEEANVSPAFVDYCGITGGNCITKKSIETRLKLKKVNKK